MSVDVNFVAIRRLDNYPMADFYLGGRGLLELIETSKAVCHCGLEMDRHTQAENHSAVEMPNPELPFKIWEETEAGRVYPIDGPDFLAWTKANRETIEYYSGYTAEARRFVKRHVTECAYFLVVT